MTERWLPVPSLPEYEVSDEGRVRSARRGHVLAQRLVRGYCLVWLLGSGYLVHRLVLRAFVGEPEPGQEGAHWNGNSADNRLANLRWASRDENERDKVAHGSAPRRERHPRARLTEAAIAEIRAAPKMYGYRKALAARFGVSVHAIADVLGERSWRNGTPKPPSVLT